MKTFYNADYYVEKDNYEKRFSSIEEALGEGFKKSEIVAAHSMLLLSDRHGIYIPQIFAENYDDKNWNIKKDDKDFQILLKGPHGSEWYWEAWDIFSNHVEFTDSQGLKHFLEQDGDLFSVAYIEFDEKEETIEAV